MSAKPTVLYVCSDDEAPSESVDTTILDGWNVVTAASAATIRDALTDGSVDCILYDHGGTDEETEVADFGDVETPVLYRTDEPDGRVASAATEAGADGYCHGGEDVDARLRALVGDDDNTAGTTGKNADETAETVWDSAVTSVTSGVDASEAFAAAVLERVGEAFFAFDTEWRFTHVNARAAKLLGYGRDELIGENVWETFPDAADLAYYDQFTHAMAHQEPVEFEEYYEPLDLWTAVRAYPDSHGLTVVFRDVTERKRYEQMLPGLLQTTRDMMQADDREEIADQTVAAAEDLLGLDLTLVRFHDPDEGTLVPVSGTDSLEPTLGERPLYAEDEGGPGEAFQTGEPTFSGDPTVDSIASALYLPLDEYGTLSAGFETGERLGTVEQQTAELLAANATAALDRIERRARLERSETVIESVEDMLYVLDVEGNFVYVTDPFVEFVGYDRSELLGNTPAMLVDDAVLGRGREVIEKLLHSDERSITVQTDVRTADGDKVPIEVDLSLLLDDDGEFDGSVGVVRDVTALRETRKRLRSENERFRYLFDHIPDPLVEVEFDGQKPIITRVNPAFERVFGIQTGYAIGSSVNDLIIPEDAVGQASYMDQVAFEGEVITEEVRRLTATGEGHFLFRGVSYQTDDSRRGFGIYTDISERKDRERRLEVLHTVLRHNLRTEMNLIGGYAEQLERELGEHIELVTDIRREAKQVADLSDTAREVERALDRDGSDRLGRCDVTPYVKTAVEEAREAYPHSTIEVDFPDEAEAVADRRLVFALSSAIENAVEHNDKETPTVLVGVDADPTTVEIRIEDDGPGIPQREQDLVQGERDITQLQHGSGLGLWAISWVVQAFGGEVGFEKGDDGSVVVLRLRRQ